MNIFQFTRLTALYLKSGQSGHKKAAKKAVKNLIIKSINQRAVLSRCLIKVNSIFFDVGNDLLWLYTTTKDINNIQKTIICAYEKGRIIAWNKTGSSISQGLKNWLDAALLQTVQSGRTFETERLRDRFEQEKRLKGKLRTELNTSYISIMDAILLSP